MTVSNQKNSKFLKILGEKNTHKISVPCEKTKSTKFCPKNFIKIGQMGEKITIH